MLSVNYLTNLNWGESSPAGLDYFDPEIHIVVNWTYDKNIFKKKNGQNWFPFPDSAFMVKNIWKTTIAVNGSDSQLDSKWCWKKLVGFLPGTEWPHWMHWTFDVQLGIDFDGVKTTAKMLSCGLLLACSRVHKETPLERGLW